MLKILFFGDVSGAIGRKAIQKILPKLKKEYKPDFVIANADNLSHGKGTTQKNLLETQEFGVDFFTSGNHAFKKEDPNEIIANKKVQMIIPENHPKTKAGNGYKITKIGKYKVAMLNLLGKTFMEDISTECPFKTFDAIYKKIQKDKPDFVIVDFHTETTSEKVAMGYYVDGRASAILGTHTHIQTNDAQILEKGTAYLTDIGMVGAKNSVIGVDKDIIIDKFLNDSKIIFEIPEKGIAKINAVLLELNPNFKKNKITLINEEVLI